MRLRNEDDMFGMDFHGETGGRSPTQFYDFAHVPAEHSEVALRRGLMPEFDAARELEKPAPEPMFRRNARIFDPAEQLQALAVGALGAEGLAQFSRKDQTTLRASKKKQAQEKAMAKAKPAGKRPLSPVLEHEEREEDEGDDEMPIATKKPAAKGKATAKAKAKSKAKASPTETPNRGRGRGRGRGGATGRGKMAVEIETPGPRGDPVEEETPSSASLKKPVKRKAKELQGKDVKGLPLHLREECKKFLNCMACIHVDACT